MKYATNFPSYTLSPVLPDVLKELSHLYILTNNCHLLLSLLT